MIKSIFLIQILGKVIVREWVRTFSILLACLFFFCDYALLFSDDTTISLEYSIHPVLEKSALEVHVKFLGSEKGATEILLPSSWAGQNELYVEISDLHCLSPNTAIEHTEKPHVKIIHHFPNESIQLSYQVTSREKKEIEWYYRPVVQPSYFFFFGHCFFIVPSIDDKTMSHITIEWNFPEWNLANSFGVQQCKQELFLPLASFQHGVYVGGDFQILQCGEAKSPIFVAIRGKWSFSNEGLTHLIQTVIESHRKFWNDFDFPYYLITVLPIGDDHHMGGTGLFNAFSIFIGDTSEDNEKDWKWLAWLLSHEHFHTWNGLKMISTPSEALYWFTEGFTEYYAVKLNEKNQLIDHHDFQCHTNTIKNDYITSPVRNEKNERIEKDFWNNHDVQRLPYVRGFLFALRWDKKIQIVSDGKWSLDDFMLALFKRTQERKRLFSQEDIEQVASIFLPLQEVQEDIKEYILEGKTIPLDEIVM